MLLVHSRAFQWRTWNTATPYFLVFSSRLELWVQNGVLNAEGMSKWKPNHPKAAAYSSSRPRCCVDEFMFTRLKMQNTEEYSVSIYVSSEPLFPGIFTGFICLKHRKSLGSKDWNANSPYHQGISLTVLCVYLQWHCLKPKYRADLWTILLPCAQYTTACTMATCPRLLRSYLTASGHITEEKLCCSMPARENMAICGDPWAQRESLAPGLGHSISSVRGPFTYETGLPVLPSMCSPWVPQQCCTGRCCKCASWVWDGRKGQITD